MNKLLILCGPTATGKTALAATVAKQFLMEHVEEQKVTEARKKGFSIRKVAEITGVRYDKVLEILRRTGIDEETDDELDQYMDNVAKSIKKKK